MSEEQRNDIEREKENADEGKEEMLNEVEQQRLMNLYKKQMFNSTQETPTPQGFNANLQFEENPQNIQGMTPYDQAFINANNLVSESFFMKGNQNRYVKFKAQNDLIEAHEQKKPLPDYTKISLYNYYI